MKIVPVNLEAYPDFIKSMPVIVIHFWASWNLYDEEMKDRLKNIDTSLADQVAIGSVDMDQQEMWELASELKVLNLPALVYYKNGKHVETVIGLRHKEQIEIQLKNLLAAE